VVVDECIKGIANRIQVLTDNDSANTAKVCSLATLDAHGEYVCHLESARRFTYYNSLEFALVACDGLPDALRSSCRDTATLSTEQRRSDMAKYNAQDSDGNLDIF
jgi:hypothetical protein